MFEELSGGPLPNGRYPDITLAIFPKPAGVFWWLTPGASGANIEVMSTDAVVQRRVLPRGGKRIRQPAERRRRTGPFLHLMQLPGQLDDILRGRRHEFHPGPAGP